MSDPKTVFCDIDGVLFKHPKSATELLELDTKLLPGVKDRFHQWDSLGYRIIITTGRPESLRELTHLQLTQVGLFYHDLLMSLPRGHRIVINDERNGEVTALGICLTRDEGLAEIDLESSNYLAMLA